MEIVIDFSNGRCPESHTVGIAPNVIVVFGCPTFNRALLLQLGNHLSLQLGNHLSLQLGNHLSLQLGNHLSLQLMRYGVM
jgi:hypothetical protein